MESWETPLFKGHPCDDVPFCSRSTSQENLSNSISSNYQKIPNRTRRPETWRKSEKETTFTRRSTSLLSKCFMKTLFACNNEKTYTAAGFSLWPFINILLKTYRGKCIPAIRETTFIQTLIKKIRPRYDTQAIACARAITCANQEKGVLARQ